jgi:hypothetical protein
MDELAKKLVELSDRLGPQVVDAARGAARMAAYSALQGHIVALVVAAAVASVAVILWRRNAMFDDDLPAGRACAGLLFGVAALVASLALAGITDPWLWSTFNHPDLWIAKRVLNL